MTKAGDISGSSEENGWSWRRAGGKGEGGPDLKDATGDPGVHKVYPPKVPTRGCMDADVLRPVTNHLPEHLWGGLDQHAPPAIGSVRMQRVCEGQPVVAPHLQPANSVGIVQACPRDFSKKSLKALLHSERVWSAKPDQLA